MEEGRKAGRPLMERKKKFKGKNRSLQNTSTDLKGMTFVILKNLTRALIRKERFESNKPCKEGD